MTRRGASSRLSAEERDARLRIMQADGIGSAAIKVLAAATSSAAEALSLGMDAWRALGGLDERHVAALQAAERAPVDIAWPDGWDLYWPADGDYPPLLREIDDPPMFWAMGDVAMLHQFCVAVVGTRKCSDYGRRTAYMLSGALVAAGACVVSGLAYGIDAAAHKGALVEEGSTVAVMGCGPGRVYPGGNRSLQKRIGDEGVLVSEFLPDAKPAPWHFPRRNRIISGLCKATVVVEEKSTVPFGEGRQLDVEIHIGRPPHIDLGLGSVVLGDQGNCPRAGQGGFRCPGKY